MHRFYPSVSKLDIRLRLPLIELCIPTLHQLAPKQFEHFRDVLKALAQADNHTDLFEFALEKMVIHQLAPHFRSKADTTVRYTSLNPVEKECRLLLSSLAHLSQHSADATTKAFQAGVNRLQMGTILSPLTKDECGLDRIDEALSRLAQTSVTARQKIVQACAETIMADGVIKVGEAELFRAICATMDVPCPPLI